jgi:hypothetical protein
LWDKTTPQINIIILNEISRHSPYTLETIKSLLNKDMDFYNELLEPLDISVEDHNRFFMIYYPKNYDMDKYDFTYKKDLTTEGIEPNPGPSFFQRVYVTGAGATYNSRFYGPQYITFNLRAQNNTSAQGYITINSNCLYSDGIDVSTVRVSPATGFTHTFYSDQNVTPQFNMVPDNPANIFNGTIVFDTSKIQYEFEMNTEQDKDRTGTATDDIVQPEICKSLGAYCQGDTISNISQMIQRSTYFTAIYPTDTQTIHLMTHAFGSSDKNAAGTVEINGFDNLSYFAHLFAFARGGVNYRLQATGNYRVLLAPNNDINQTLNQSFPLVEQTGILSNADRIYSSNLVQQSINTSVEGFGEFTIPFYSSTYCYSVDPRNTVPVYKATTEFTLPDTQTLIFPMTNLSELVFFRNSTSDFEFSYLSGPPLLLPT